MQFFLAMNLQTELQIVKNSKSATLMSV